MSESENTILRAAIAKLSEAEQLLSKVDGDFLENIPELLDEITVFILETISEKAD